MISLGLIGYPLEHSLSPKIHMAALDYCGLKGIYFLFHVLPDDPQGLRDLIDRIRSGEITGLNVTIPHKQSIISFVDELTPTALAVGAVNTVYMENGKITAVGMRDMQTIPTQTVILCTGGSTFIGTGSTGDGYQMAQAAGHTIVPLRPALVPLKTAGSTAQRLQGLSLRNIRFNVFFDQKKKFDAFGEMLFTHFGVSGPVVLSHSGEIVDALRAGKHVSISIDLKPALSEKKLDARLLRELDQGGKQYVRTMLKRLLPSKMIVVCADHTKIPLDRPCHQVTAQDRHRLLAWLKNLRLQVTDSLPLEAGMVTMGGVSLKEVNPRTMESKIVDGLFFAGEVLDLAADTGGFNLQAAFSTGWVAGQNAAPQPFTKE